MKLLISNDDGIFARGVRSLANALAEAGHDVTVVCPDRERSATGHSLTLHKPIRVERVEDIFLPEIEAWACTGTPSDCVKLGMGTLMRQTPDYVLSGINQGANLGTDVLYSGTVSAAMEGIIEGIPSIALSLTSSSCQEFGLAASFARAILTQLAKQPLESLMLLNVNVPAVKLEEIAGIAITRQGVRRYEEVFQKRVDPRGKTYYWLAGEVAEDISQMINPDSTIGEIPTDVQANCQNYITVTPLQYNLTCKVGLESLQQSQLRFSLGQHLNGDRPVSQTSTSEEQTSDLA